MTFFRPFFAASLLVIMTPSLAARTGPIVIDDLTSPVVTAGEYNTSKKVAIRSEDPTEDGGLMVLMHQMQEYRQQISSLQGQLEQLNHQVDQMQSSARDRYLDLDTRLSQLEGDGVESPNSDVGVTQTSGAATTQVKTPPVADPKKDAAAYLAARNKIMSDDRQSAIDALNGYITDFPQGRHLADAHYWLGEVYRLKGDKASLASADKELQIFIDDYPNDSKMPNALYKFANVKAQQGEDKKAKAILQRIVDEFPKSDKAVLAKKTLATF